MANRKCVPLFNNKIKYDFKARQIAKRKWCYSKTVQDLSIFNKKKKLSVIITLIISSKTVSIRESCL